MAVVDVSKIPNNNKFDPVREAILELEGQIAASTGGVFSINGEQGEITLQAGDNVTITNPSDGVIRISSTASGTGTLDGSLTLTAGGGIGLSSPSVFDGTTDVNVTITNTDRPNDGELLFVAGAGLTTTTAATWTEEIQTWETQGRIWSIGQADVFSANTSENVSITIQHDDTSSQPSITGSGGIVIQSIGLDTFGHVTSAVPVNLDLRYRAFRTFITEDDNDSIIADTYNDTITFDGSASISVTKDANLKKINIGLALSDIRFDNGVRVARGFLYWQEQGQPTSADTPTASTFDFTTGKITINDSSWDQVPPLTGSSITEYYIARYESRDDGGGTSSARSVTYDDPIEATGFEGPVTFNSLSEELGSNGFTIIDGGRIKTGRVQSLGLNAVDYDAGTSVYTGEGTLFDLENGDLVSEQFSIVNGNASFKGDLSAASGQFGTVRINKNVGGTDFAIYSDGFALTNDGVVTIGGITFPVVVYADDAAGNNRSLTQGTKEFALFTSSGTPPEDLTQTQIDAFTGTFVRIVGLPGTDARAVNLTAEDFSFEYSTDGTSPSPSSITITASALNTEGVVYYEFFLDDVSQQNTTSNTYTYTPQASYDNMPEKVEVKIREGSNSSAVLATDQITLFGIKAGRDAYTIILTNESHTLPATNLGVATYTDSGTQIIAYKGTTELNGITSGTPTDGQFKVTAVGTDITPGAISSPGNPIIVADHSNMTQDLATVEFTINVENKSTFVKQQTLTKSKEGNPGIDGLSPVAQSIKNGAITTVYIFYDANQNGVYDAGVDTLIDTFTINDGEDGYVGVDGNSPTISTSKVGDTTTVTVYYDLNANGVYDAGTDVLLDQFTLTDGQDGTDGLPGIDGISTFLASIFKRSATAPSTPTGGSYNFTTTTLTPPTGWSATIPSGTDPVYIATALANIQGTTGTDTTLNWSAPVVFTRDGIDGLDGDPGTPGADGKRYATGVVFYQLAQNPGSAPTATQFNFSDGSFTGLTTNWLPTSPEIEPGTSTNRYYTSYYIAVETFAGSGVGSVSFEDPQSSYNFSQVVTFSSLQDPINTVIDGGTITTGVIRSNDYIAQAGSVFSASGMAIDLSNDTIETPEFAIDSSGSAYFSSGKITLNGPSLTLSYHQVDNTGWFGSFSGGSLNFDTINANIYGVREYIGGTPSFPQFLDYMQYDSGSHLFRGNVIFDDGFSVTGGNVNLGSNYDRVSSYTGGTANVEQYHSIKLPGGAIIKWGYHTGTTVTNFVPFPVAFPTNCSSVSVTTDRNSQGNNGANHAYSVSRTGFVAVIDSAYDFWWIAIGF